MTKGHSSTNKTFLPKTPPPPAPRPGAPNQARSLQKSSVQSFAIPGGGLSSTGKGTEPTGSPSTKMLNSYIPTTVILNGTSKIVKKVGDSLSQSILRGFTVVEISPHGSRTVTQTLCHPGSPSIRLTTRLTCTTWLSSCDDSIGTTKLWQTPMRLVTPNH